ncbi:hypothetical protein RRF57_003784 [Xylaria bambusicola]|uniref:Uncharacterized protein n=1 Tax=Xylaria bambusicola TaxID=326684 RepID=A0AAN7UV25_9PEZI
MLNISHYYRGCRPLGVKWLGNAPLKAAILAEDFDVVDEPVNVLEVGRVVSDIFFASARLSCAGGIVTKDFTGPNTTECSVKYDVVVCELPPEKEAAGLPQVLGSGLPASISTGTEPRGKKKTLSASEVHCKAYTPPPISLKPAP